MTSKEAAIILRQVRAFMDDRDTSERAVIGREAFDMVINALEEKSKGVDKCDNISIYRRSEAQ